MGDSCGCDNGNEKFILLLFVYTRRRKGTAEECQYQFIILYWIDGIQRRRTGDGRRLALYELLRCDGEQRGNDDAQRNGG